MRCLSVLILAVAVAVATPAVVLPAMAQKPTGLSDPGKYQTKLPAVPPGQWGDGILKGAKIQSYDGRDYYAVEFETLQEHVDSICHFDSKASILDAPVATIVGYRQNMGWPALVDGRQVDIMKSLDEGRHLDKLILPYILVDVTPFLDDVRNNEFFKACGGMNFRVCSVAIYGRFRRVQAKTIPDFGADLAVGDRKCIFQLEHYRKMGVVDFGQAFAQASLDSFFQGLAVGGQAK